MSGNVFEWCYDLYEDSFTSGNVSNPTGASSGSNRIARGGGWYDDAFYSSVCCRLYNGPVIIGYENIGFRVVRNAN